MALQGQLKAVLGIDYTLIPLDNASASANRTAGDFDTFIDLAASTHLPGPTADRTYSSTSTSGGAAGYNDPEVDSLITKQKTEYDSEARGKLFEQLERKLLDLCWSSKISANKLWAIRQGGVHDWRHNHSSRASVMNPSSIWMDDTAPDSRKSAN